MCGIADIARLSISPFGENTVNEIPTQCAFIFGLKWLCSNLPLLLKKIKTDIKHGLYYFIFFDLSVVCRDTTKTS